MLHCSPKQFSAGFLGTHIEAVYHTAIVFGGIEYLYGAGVQTCIPGSSHHGRPMEVIDLGATSLPQDVILEYLSSLKEIYTAEVSMLDLPLQLDLLNGLHRLVVRFVPPQLQQLFQ